MGFSLDFVENRLLVDVEEYKFEVNGRPLLNTFQYYLQAFGLVSCLFGYSIFTLFENLIFYISIKVSTDQHIFNLIFKLKNIFVILLIFYAIFNFNELFKKHYDKIVENEKFIVKNYHEDYKIYFCFFMSRMIKDSPYLDNRDYKLNERIFGKNLFYNNTIDYLFKNSKKFEDVLINVQSNIRGEKVNYKKGQLVFNKGKNINMINII